MTKRTPFACTANIVHDFTDLQGPPSLPPGLGGSFPPGCTVLAMDKDDRNGLNGDDKKSGPGNPNCQPASP